MKSLKLNALIACSFALLSSLAVSADKVDDAYCRKLSINEVAVHNLPLEFYPPIFQGCSEGAQFASISYSIDNDKTKSEETKKAMIKSLSTSMHLDKPPISDGDLIYLKFFTMAAESQIEYLMNKDGR